MITESVEFHINAYAVSRDNTRSSKHCDCKYVKQQPLDKGWQRKGYKHRFLWVVGLRASFKSISPCLPIYLTVIIKGTQGHSTERVRPGAALAPLGRSILCSLAPLPKLLFPRCWPSFPYWSLSSNIHSSDPVTLAASSSHCQQSLSVLSSYFTFCLVRTKSSHCTVFLFILEYIVCHPLVSRSSEGQVCVCLAHP